MRPILQPRTGLQRIACRAQAAHSQLPEPVSRSKLLRAGAASLPLLSPPQPSRADELPQPAPGAQEPQPSTSGRAPPPPPSGKRPVVKKLPRVPMVKVADGLELSQVIRGCWQLGGEHGGDPASDHTSGPQAIEDLDRFVRAGVTSLDTAPIYGPAEALVGQYLRLQPDRRPQLQVATKLCVMAEDLQAGGAQGISADMVEFQVRASLRRLGVSRVALVQLYWDDFSVPGWVDAAKALADLQGKGLVGHIGLTNFDVRRMIPILDAGVKIATNQVAFSVLDRRPQLLQQEYCAKHGIALLPYGVLAGGFLAKRYLGRPAKAAVLDTVSKAKYGSIIRQLGGWAWLQEVLAVLARVAEKHGVSLSAVAAKWVLQQPQVPAIILGARNAYHVRDWQALSTFALDEDDLMDLDAVYEGAPRPPLTDCYVWERGGKWS